MKKILVTGSEGYIGSVLVPMLIKKGYDVTGLDIGYYLNCDFGECKFTSTYNLVKKDIRNISAKDLVGFDGVIHLAALCNDYVGMINEQATYDINHKAAVKLAESSKLAGVERFIFSSSCSLYGKGGASILDENSIVFPQTAYAKSKIYSENDISKFADESFSPVYMRNATVFGVSPRMRFDIVVNSLTGFAYTAGEIKILGDGKPWRPLVHVKDVCKSFILALEAKKEKVHNQAFNIGFSNYQIKTVAEHIGKVLPECKITIAQKDAGDSRDYNVSFKKVGGTLGFIPDYSLDDGIKELLEMYKKVELDSSMFSGRLFTRLSQLKYLQDGGVLDSFLFYNSLSQSQKKLA